MIPDYDPQATIIYATLAERLDRLFADAREYNLRPCELQVPDEFARHIDVRHDEGEWREERGIPVVRRADNQVILVCDGGTVHFTLISWRDKEDA